MLAGNGVYDNLMPESTISPQSGTKNLTSALSGYLGRAEISYFRPCRLRGIDPLTGAHIVSLHLVSQLASGQHAHSRVYCTLK